MSDCGICKWFREEAKPDGTGRWSCENSDVIYSEFVDQLMDDADDCHGFYPGSHGQTGYIEQPGGWWHRCTHIPLDVSIDWDSDNHSWHLTPLIGATIPVTFCPWCGRKLRPMPAAPIEEER